MNHGLLGRAFAALCFAASLVLAAPDAQADMLPGPDESGCATLDAGDRCILSNGAPGRCRANVDPRRNRRWTFCEAIPECDVVAVGAPCHALGGRAAHCREILDDRTRQPFRMCVIDPDAYDSNGMPTNAADASTPPSNAAPTPSRAVAPAMAPATGTPAATRGRCSVGPIGAGGGGWLACATAALAVLASRRRRAARL